MAILCSHARHFLALNWAYVKFEPLLVFKRGGGADGSHERVLCGNMWKGKSNEIEIVRLVYFENGNMWDGLLKNLQQCFRVLLVILDKAFTRPHCIVIWFHKVQCIALAYS